MHQGIHRYLDRKKHNKATRIHIRDFPSHLSKHVEYGRIALNMFIGYNELRGDNMIPI